MTRKSFLVLLALLGPALTMAGQGKVEDCPAVHVTGPAGLAEVGEPVDFSVRVAPFSDTNTLAFTWTVTAGKLIGGQGTQRVTVIPPTEVGAPSLTVTVKINGLPEGCPDVASETIAVSDFNCGLHIPVDIYSRVPWRDEQLRLDNFAMHLLGNREPGTRALVSVTLAPGETVGQQRRRLLRMQKHLKSRLPGLGTGQIVFTFKWGESHGTALWIFPKGVELPECHGCSVLTYP